MCAINVPITQVRTLKQGNRPVGTNLKSSCIKQNSLCEKGTSEVQPDGLDKIILHCQPCNYTLKPLSVIHKRYMYKEMPTQKNPNLGDCRFNLKAPCLELPSPQQKENSADLQIKHKLKHPKSPSSSPPYSECKTMNFKSIFLCIWLIWQSIHRTGRGTYLGH